MLSRVAVSDAHSIKILLLNSAAGAVLMSLKAIWSALLIPIHLTAHLAVAHSLRGEGDRAAANVDCLAAHLPPSSSDWLQSSGAALAGRHLTDHHPASRLTWRNAIAAVSLNCGRVPQPVVAGAQR